MVHPAPGNLTGTLVNAVLYHCNLPEYELPPEQGPQTLSPWPGEHFLLWTAYVGAVQASMTPTHSPLQHHWRFAQEIG